MVTKKVQIINLDGFYGIKKSLRRSQIELQA